MTEETRPKDQKVRSAPHLPATAVHAELRRPNKHAVYVRIKVMDSKGETYYFESGCFHYDLKHADEVQP